MSREITVSRVLPSAFVDMWTAHIDGYKIGCGSWEWCWAQVHDHLGVTKLEDATEIRVNLGR